MAMQDDKYLNRPLYVFDLPHNILNSLQVKIQSSLDVGTEDGLQQPVAVPENHDGTAKSSTACGLCRLQFNSLQEQKKHIRSDLHGYNTKQRMRGQKAVSETEFEELLGQLDESISGSDTTDSDVGENDDDLGDDKTNPTMLSALLKRQAKIADGRIEEESTQSTKRDPGKPPLLWFKSTILPSNVSLGIYRAIFTLEEQAAEPELVVELHKKQLASKSVTSKSLSGSATDDADGGVPLPPNMQATQAIPSGPHYFLCMIGGGHFAAMLVSLTPKITKKNGLEDRSASVLAHKTFHRYTTRRKQGGSQSANDNSKGTAHSAGSSLRRYNEAALEKDVRQLLTEWKASIEAAQLLFIRATGVTNRRTLFGPYEGQVLSNKDGRIRGFPFSTKRATQAELMRAFVELTRVKVSTVDESALARQAAAAAAAQEASDKAAKSTSKSSSTKPAKLSQAEEEAMVHTTQLQALIRRSKAPGMLSYLQSNNIDANTFRFVPHGQNHHAPTLLHFAAASNTAPCASTLMLKAGADPSLRNGDGKTPFEIAGDRLTRDAFRLARTQLGEDKWAWEAAGVPSALSQSDVEARNAREKDEKSAEEAAESQRRVAEIERLRSEEAEKLASRRDQRLGKGHTIGSVQLTAEERRMEQARGMSDEMRLRLEREKRARAAEERMRRMQNR